ncbi:MAG TPA: DNA cytosine methyltransferase, partial [Longimicrobium sp.]|nr:DNA cytosine methyltransferase [Longimicrobium sp.]
MVDFFSGCGGTSAGLRAAGLNVALAIDNNLDATRTYEANFGQGIALNRDITTLTPQQIEPWLNDFAVDDLVLFSACAPCQPFSRQNRTGGSADDRYPLLLDFVRFVWYFKPDLIFLENVPGVDQVRGTARPFATCLHTFSNLG